jgi:hypothetical protein
VSKLAKGATAALLAATFTGMLAGSANAAAGAYLAPAIGLPSIQTHSVAPACTAGPGVSTSLGSVTYTVYGTATATSTNGTAAVATGITCWIQDWYTGQVYGAKLSQALPGPAAVVAGTVTVPFQSDPRLCASANALFTNNVTTAYSTC